MITKENKKIRIGLIARMDRTGLGYQTKALFDMLKPEKTLVVNSTPFNGNPQIPEWYQFENNHLNLQQDRFVAYTMGMNEDLAFEWLLYDLDVVITCEVPYHDRLYAMARERGIKVILQPNAELNPHFREPELDKPDYFFLPSTWYENETRQLGVPTVVCPPPIAMQPAMNPVFKDEGTLKVLHIAGKRALGDRNGTEIVQKLNDMPGVELTIRTQDKDSFPRQEDLYKGGFHVLLMPRRYGGLCMPMLEALSQGMPVLMTDIEPNNTVLPAEWLLKWDFKSMLMTKRLINSYATNPNSIRSTLDRFKNMNQLEYEEEQAKARKIFADYKKSLDRWEFYINRIMEDKL